MFSHRDKAAVPPAQPLPPVESTLPALNATRRQHRDATPRHKAVVKRADATLKMFDDYLREDEFLREHHR